MQKGSSIYRLAPCLVFFVLSLTTRAQQYFFSHLTTTNGLISNSIGSICQDNRGFIWISTLNGLQRYDGTRFVNYEMNMKDSAALHNSIVTSVFEDSRHRFWVGTAEGVYQMNRNTGKFYNYNLHLAAGHLPVVGANGFTEDGNSDIWFLNIDGYFKLDPKTNQFENESSSTGILAGSRPGLIAKDGKGNIWFTTSKGVKCYMYRLRKIIDRSNDPDDRKIFSIPKMITSILLSGNFCWYGFAGERKVYRYDFVSNSTVDYTIPEPVEKGYQSLNKYYDIRITYLGSGPGNIVIAGLAGEGIAIYEPAKNVFTPVIINNDDPNGLHAEKESFLGSEPFTDREKNIWLPTGQGINIFNPLKKHFTYYGQHEGIPDYEANYILQNPADSDIFVSFYSAKGGIVRLSKDLKFKKHYLFTDKPQDAGKNQIWCMYLDEKGILWAPNQNRTTLKLNTRTDELTETKDSLLSGYISLIQKDNYGYLWVGTWSLGLKQYDLQTKRVSTFIEPPPGS